MCIYLRTTVLIFGTPCVGKTSTAREIMRLRNNTCLLSVDKILSEIIEREPNKIDFALHADQIIDRIFLESMPNFTTTLIEMGCLFTREQAEKVIRRAQKNSYTLSVELTCCSEIAAARAKERNRAVECGDSSALPIDDPQSIEDFSQIYEPPNGLFSFDTSAKSKTQVAEDIIFLIRNKFSKGGFD